MRKRGVGKLEGGEFVLDGKGANRNELGSVGAKDVDAEDFVGGGVGEDFDKPFGFVCALRTGIYLKGKRSDFVIEIVAFGFGFGHAHGGDFGVGVDDTRDG